MSRPLAGAVAFVQSVGSALQLTLHFHVLVREAVFEELDDAKLRLHPLARSTERLADVPQSLPQRALTPQED